MIFGAFQLSASFRYLHNHAFGAPTSVDRHSAGFDRRIKTNAGGRSCSSYRHNWSLRCRLSRSVLIKGACRTEVRTRFVALAQWESNKAVFY